MKTIHSSILALSVAALLAACTGQESATNAQQGGILGGGGLDKSDVGTVIGGVGGAVLGSSIGGGGHGGASIAGGIIGGVVGAGLGHAIGASLDRADMAYYSKAQQQALETAPAGQALPWQNPQNGHSGTFVPQAPYQNPNGQYCREFTQTINVGGKPQSGYGTACRQPDGTWKIVSQ